MEEPGSDAEQTGELDELPDEVLVRRAALGDREAFSQLVRRHGPAMFRYAMTMLGGHVQDAEDATQNAFVQAWQHLPGFRGASSLRTWLFRITAREVMALRGRRRPVPVDNDLLSPLPASPEWEPAPRVDDAELQDALMAALGELPWRQRACWILAEQEDLTYRQIASILDVSVPVVRGQLHRARATLAVRMAHWR